MSKLVQITGEVQRFDGQCWSEVNFTVPIEVSIIGTINGWTYANVEGDVPIRWLEIEPSVSIRTAEPVLL